MYDTLEPLHNTLSSDVSLTPEGGQRGLLCSNKQSDRCSPLGVINDIKFSPAEIKQFIGLARIFKQIHIRLLIEGYVIKDGRIYKP